MFEHFVEEVCCAEARCLGTNERTAVAETFSREDAVLVCADDFLILTEQIADFASADTHISCRNVHIGTDVTIKLGHERLAKRMISESLLPVGSKSEPPFAPPMGREVREFLKVCSKPRNFMASRLTSFWNLKPPL